MFGKKAARKAAIDDRKYLLPLAASEGELPLKEEI